MPRMSAFIAVPNLLSMTMISMVSIKKTLLLSLPAFIAKFFLDSLYDVGHFQCCGLGSGPFWSDPDLHPCFLIFSASRYKKKHYGGFNGWAISMFSFCCFYCFSVSVSVFVPHP
jgi:hypothetical protein